VDLRQMSAADPAISNFLVDRGSEVVARRGELVNALTRPAVAAFQDGAVIGVLVYDIAGTDCEILALYAADRQTGVGTALVSTVAELATGAGCRRYWVVTTNDNVDALRFYQRRGFRLSVLRPGAVDESRRTLKPQIPPTGEYGIPLRDEIELAQGLGS
jgi:GNAT superfamily N-acetyltransferase